MLELIQDTQVEHMGSTAIPGAVTKGDVDLLVQVKAEAFQRACVCLRRAYEVHQPENWSPTYASFVESGATGPPVGIQLVVAGSPDDSMLCRFRDLLASDRALLAEYNALKLRYDGAGYDEYTDAKAEFIASVLRRSA